MTEIEQPPPSIPGFTDLSRIAEGGSSIVYRGRRADLWYAIKVFSKTFSDSATAVAFQTEETALSRLGNHPNILKVYSSDILPDGRPYLITELCDGSLVDLVDLWSHLSESTTIRIGYTVAAALRTAHMAGLIHGDVAPSNILLRASGAPVLSDFGLAIKHASLVKIKGFTTSFAAPEVLLEQAINNKSDVYGLGATLYFMISGNPPFRSTSGHYDQAFLDRVSHEPPPELPSDISSDLRGLIMSSLRKYPADRPDIFEVVEILGRVGIGGGESSRSPERSKWGNPLTSRPIPLRSIDTSDTSALIRREDRVSTHPPRTVADPEIRKILHEVELRSGEARVELAAELLADKAMWIPVTVFTSDDDGTDIAQAIFQAAELFGLEVAYQTRPERGSWFGRSWIRTKQVFTHDEVKKRSKKLENAIELEILGKRRAEVDKAKADAIASILTAIAKQPHALVRIGTILIVKSNDSLRVETISEQVAAELEMSPALLQDPGAALAFLDLRSAGPEKTISSLVPLKELPPDEGPNTIPSV